MSHVEPILLWRMQSGQVGKIARLQHFEPFLRNLAVAPGCSGQGRRILTPILGRRIFLRDLGSFHALGFD